MADRDDTVRDMVKALENLIARSRLAYDMYPRNGSKWEAAMRLDAAITAAETALSAHKSLL